MPRNGLINYDKNLVTSKIKFSIITISFNLVIRNPEFQEFLGTILENVTNLSTEVIKGKQNSEL